MKLHAIEVTNLNSLYGTQSVNLDDDLKGASLFLIRGPTGSGKSTLMDAVSLALFATTPRLGHLRSSGAVAEQIMSRGTGACAAQVEFSKLNTETGIRERYRARWAARRSREKPDGNMQAVHRSLEKLQPDGAWKGKSDHRDKVIGPEFERVLEGFSTSDFQRSMLLAQGQFDAMLHASASERASILERLTDTSDYQRIGELAFRMNKAWGGRIGKLKTTVDAISPVGEEELAEARTLVAEGTGALTALKASVRSVEGQQRWLADSARCAEQGEQVASAKLALAEEEQAAASELQSLAEAERCRPGLELLEDVQATAARQLKAAERLQATQAGLPGLMEHLNTASAAAKIAHEQHESASLGLAKLREPVAQAQEAQRQLSSAEHELRTAGQHLSAAQQRAAAAQEAVTKAQGEVVDGQQVVAERQQQREALSQHEPLAAALAGLTTRASVVKAQGDSVDRERAGLAKAEEAAAVQRDTLAGREARHQQALSDGVAPLRAAESAAAAVLMELVGEEEPDAVLERLHRQALARQEQRSRLQQAVEALARRQGAAQAVGEARQALDAERAAAAENAALQGALQVQGESATQTVTLAEKVLEPLERVALYAAQREELVAGEECPLCGSTEHPHAGQAAAVARELHQAREARDEALREKASVDKMLADAVSASAAIAARMEGAERVLARSEADLARERAEVAERLQDCGLPAEASLDEVTAAQQTLLAEGELRRAAQEALQAALAKSRSMRRELEAAEQALQAETEALAAERARCAQVATGLEERRSQLEARVAEHAELRARLLADLSAVGVQATEVSAALEVASERVKALTAAVEVLAEAHRELERREAKRQEASRAAEVASTAASEEAARLVEREASVKEAAARHAGARERLAAVWGELDSPHNDPAPHDIASLAPDVLLRRQAARVDQRQESLRRAEMERAAADKAHTEALTRQAEQQQQVADLQAEHAALTARLQQVLVELSLPDREALEARRLDPATQQRVVSLRDALRARNASLEGREQVQQQEAERLQEARPAELSEEAAPEEVALRLQELMAEQAVLEERVQAARSVVDHASRQAEALAAAQAALKGAREKADVWRELSRLIGTNQGEAFKQFAQALNLDQLLLRANRHLGSLSPRYQLHTIKDADTGLPTLEFEVADAWRPGTTRSLKTLSGGESFLVSLALALGLSDLRTRSMPVETLLLDEGFGTLDPDTLEIALAALQQLQQSGRQVGIISHVVGLDERIPARILVEPVGDGRSRVRAENSDGGPS